MVRILIVFYSRTGTTGRVAEQLAAALHAPLLAIEEPHGRRGLSGYLRSAREAARRILPPILPPALDPADFDLVILGTPVWVGHVASPMRSFLQGYRSTLRHVAFFCTCGGRGAERAFLDMQHLTGRPPEATLALTAADLRTGKTGAAVAAFAARLAAPGPAAAAPAAPRGAGAAGVTTAAY